MKMDDKAIIDAYSNGQSLNFIARTFGTYATTIKRILEKNNIELRHDVVKKGSIAAKDGEKLIEWAKAQGRLVTKSELAAIAGTKKLSPTYFIKYPELGQYIQPKTKAEFQEDYMKLYNWLKHNNIPYKPNDRTTLHVSVDALLLEDYSNLAICIAEKPTDISKKTYENSIKLKKERAKEAGVTIIFLKKDDFKNLNESLNILSELKRK